MNYQELKNQASLTKLFHKEIEGVVKVAKSRSKMISIITLGLFWVYSLPWVSMNLWEQNLLSLPSLVRVFVTILNLIIWVGVSCLIYTASLNFYEFIMRLFIYTNLGVKSLSKSTMAQAIYRVDLGAEVELFFNIDGFVSSVTVSKGYASLFKDEDFYPIEVKTGQLKGSKLVKWVSYCAGVSLTREGSLRNLQFISATNPIIKNQLDNNILSLNYSESQLRLN